MSSWVDMGQLGVMPLGPLGHLPLHLEGKLEGNLAPFVGPNWQVGWPLFTHTWAGHHPMRPTWADCTMSHAAWFSWPFTSRCAWPMHVLKLVPTCRQHLLPTKELSHHGALHLCTSNAHAASTHPTAPHVSH